MNLSPKKLVWSAATHLKSLKKQAHRQWLAWKRFLAVQISSPDTTTTTIRRRLLLLTWDFPPEITGGVYRPLSFVRHAAASGWQAEVVCGPAPEAPSDAGNYLVGLLPAEVPVTRVAADTDPHPRPLPRIDGGIMNALALFEAAAARIKRGEGGVILASGPRFSNFVAGYWLARRTGWKLVLDYRDEWTLNPFTFVDKSGADSAWEKRCLAEANMVVFTTPSQLAHAQGQFPELAHSTNTVIHNGWEMGDFALALPTVKTDASASFTPITLAYLGNLGSWAAPDAFLSTLSAALSAQPELRNRIRIRLVGHKPMYSRKVLAAFPFPDVLELMDPIPKQEACSMMRTVDGLLLLNPPGMRRYIPGKLYEYIASGTPVVVFGAGGEIGENVESLGAGVTVAEGDAPALARALLGLRGMGDYPQELRQAWLASRERAALATELYRQLDILVGTPNHQA